MRKLLILVLTVTILFSGCVDNRVQTVKRGDNISINYIGRFWDGKVFDTSIESVAKANGIYNPGDGYGPANFTVGKRQVIEGLDEGVIGMKLGEPKIIMVPPEKGYPIDPSKIQVIPIISELPATRVLPKVFEIPISQFERAWGPYHSAGDTVKINGTNINITVTNITAKRVSLKYDLTVGYNLWDSRMPWNETVIKIDDTNITLRKNLTRNETLGSNPFITTVIDVNDTTVTLRHKTSIITDQNPEVAGKTLFFNVTLISIDK